MEVNIFLSKLIIITLLAFICESTFGLLEEQIQVPLVQFAHCTGVNLCQLREGFIVQSPQQLHQVRVRLKLTVHRLMSGQREVCRHRSNVSNVISLNYEKQKNY